ncbi:putative Alpha-1,3-galactosidase A [Verrucomicrobia bacterium]|nr:putative Alpha-1,3-galactosidase A [Verrucomicrobiota bacterium]
MRWQWFVFPPGCRAVAVLALGLSVRAEATTYYVATNGLDTYAGTNLAAPYKSIQRAAVRMVAGDCCFIRAGVYHQTLAPSHSGTAGGPITFSAYSNEVVTLDAADAVSGWAVWSNGIYQAPVTWSLGAGYDQVFVDGAMVHQAQQPAYGNGDVFHPGTAVVSVSSNNVISSAAWSGKPDNYWAGAWFVGGVDLMWAWQTARVISSTGSTITVDPATETSPWFSGNGRGFLWGQLDFLDADNEWQLQTNANTNTLYLRIAGGADPSTHTVEMKSRNWCVDFNGQSYITVSGLNLSAGAVRVVGNGNVLQGCRAQFLSHFLGFNSGYAEDGGVQQGGGVVISGTSNIVRNCTLLNTAGCGVKSSGTSNLITRNLIYNTDYSGTYAACLVIEGNRDTVTFNTAHSSGRDILRPGGAGLDIRFNDLSDPGRLCLDLGVIYAWGVLSQGTGGPGTRIAFNWIHDNLHPVPSPLIYLDNYDADFIVDHNVCWNSGGDAGVRINGPALGHLIYNNTLFNCSDVGTFTYQQWPTSNPNPAFWTNSVYQYAASNNLFLSASPATQLVNWTNEDFQLAPGAPAIDAGVVIAGFTDGFQGRAPDLGAYEFGALAWRAGTQSRPTLAIAKSGGGFELEASPDAAYYTLAATTNPAVPSAWIAVTNRPSVSGIQWSLALPGPAGTACYYRLQTE